MGLLSFKAFTLQEAASTKKYHPSLNDYLAKSVPDFNDGNKFSKDFSKDVMRPGFDYKTNHPSFKTSDHYHQWNKFFKNNKLLAHGSPAWQRNQENIHHLETNPDYEKYRNNVKDKEEKRPEHPQYENWLMKKDNTGIGDKSSDISKRLSASAPKHTEEQKHALKYYTGSSQGATNGEHHPSSEDINYPLIKARKSKNPVPKEIEHTVKHLDAATAHPIGHDLHVYSGVGFDPRHHLTGPKDASHGLLKSPAFISTTHDKSTADNFAGMGAENRGQRTKHILHIHLKAHDHAAHVSHLAHDRGEHETILPRNTRLKVNRTPDTHVDHEGIKHHIWHAEVDHD